MFKIDSEAALLDTFRPKDRKLVEFAADLKLPLILRDYFAWSHPAGGRVYVVFAPKGGVPTGIAFDTNGGTGAPVPQMCEWCHSPGLGTQVALLTAKLHGKKRVGVHLCADLSCKQKLEDDANRSGTSATKAIERAVERMGKFATDALNIALDGSNR